VVEELLISGQQIATRIVQEGASSRKSTEAKTGAISGLPRLQIQRNGITIEAMQGHRKGRGGPGHRGGEEKCRASSGPKGAGPNGGRLTQGKRTRAAAGNLRPPAMAGKGGTKRGRPKRKGREAGVPPLAADIPTASMAAAQTPWGLWCRECRPMPLLTRSNPNLGGSISLNVLSSSHDPSLPNRKVHRVRWYRPGNIR